MDWNWEFGIRNELNSEVGMRNAELRKSFNHGKTRKVTEKEKYLKLFFSFPPQAV